MYFYKNNNKNRRQKQREKENQFLAWSAAKAAKQKRQLTEIQ